MRDHDRRHGRVPVAFQVTYSTAGAFLVAYTSNLSQGGVFLDTPTPLPVGTAVKLSFTTPSAPEPIVVDAVVAWVRETPTPEGHPAGMGLQFGQLDDRYGSVIDRLVAGFAGLRILIVAADPAARALVSRYLRSIISAQVVEAIDAETAMTAIEGHVDLCVLDLDDGADAERTIARAREAPDPVPVIALVSTEADRDRARALGVGEVIPSPPAFSALQAAVIRSLAKPAAVR